MSTREPGRRSIAFGERHARGQRQQRRRAIRIDARAARRQDDRHVQAAARRRKPGAAAAAAAGGLRVGDDDGALAASPLAASVAATSLVEPMRRKEQDATAEPAEPRARARERVGEIRRQRRRARSTRSERFDLEADVDGRRRVRQRADRDEVGAGRGQLRDALERHAAGDLDLRAAARAARPPRESRRCDMLSTRTMSAPAASASSTCVERLRLDLDRQARADARARARPRACDAAGEPDVVVLDQDRVEEADAMVRRAAGAHRVLLERAQRRRRLARVEDGDAAAGRVDELARARGDAGQPLQEIERGPLADEQRARRTRRRSAISSPGRARVAVVPSRASTRDGRLELPERLERDVEAGERRSRPWRGTRRARAASAATVASVVMSPAPTSSSSARRTRSR